MKAISVKTMMFSSDNCLVYVFVSRKKNRQRPMDSFDVIEMKLFLMFIKIQDSL